MTIKQNKAQLQSNDQYNYALDLFIKHCAGDDHTVSLLKSLKKKGY